MATGLKGVPLSLLSIFLSEASLKKKKKIPQHYFFSATITAEGTKEGGVCKAPFKGC
jgi:hypothetical protein